MKRRELITLLGGASFVGPRAASAQQAGRVRTVGLLDTRTATAEAPYLTAFKQGLQALGWTEGRNIKFDFRYTGGTVNGLSNLAADLVNLAPDVILGVTPLAVEALKQQTQSVPIVFVRMPDPVRTRVVSNLAHPGGNITGFASYDYSMGTKWLQLLKEIAPYLTRVRLLGNKMMSGSSLAFARAIEPAARSVGMEVTSSSLQDLADLQHIAGLDEQPNTGLISLPNPFVDAHHHEIVALAAQYHLPAIYNDAAIVADGGLLSYDTDFNDIFRRAASYVDRILRGAKPGDLPIQQPTRWVLSVNLRTAKALGLTVPQSILLQATEIVR